MYRDLPDGFKQTYGDFICRRQKFKNGWQAVTISNGTVFFIHPSYEAFSVFAVSKIKTSDDGKILVKNRDGKKIIYDRCGKPLTSFNSQTQLFDNGWYVTTDKDGLCLYDANSKLIGNKLRAARVFKNGMYHMSVTPNGSALSSGVFSPEGKPLCFTNSLNVKVLRNGWFVFDNMLFDNLGHLFLEPYGSRKVPNWLLSFYGRLMRPQKN